MIDKRLKKFATILVHHSLSIKKDDLFVISGSSLAAPLIKEVYQQAIEAGAHPFTHVGIDGLSEIYYKYSSERQLKYVSPLSRYEIEHIDASLSIISPENTRNMTNIDPKKQVISSTSNQGIFKRFLDRAAKKELRWCATLYPTQASAQDAEMSLVDYEDFVLMLRMSMQKTRSTTGKQYIQNRRRYENSLIRKRRSMFLQGDRSSCFCCRQKMD